MYKLALITTLTILTTLTACSKPDQNKNTQTHAASQNVAANPVVTLSTNNKADIQSDLDTVQQYSRTQEATQAAYQNKVQDAMKKQDKALIKTVVAEGKSIAQESQKGFNALTLKSKEVSDLRQTLITTSNAAFEYSDLMLAAMDDAKNLDQVKLQQLQDKLMGLQQQIATQNAHIQQILGVAASTPQAASQNN
ncbi:hypothetical protein F4V57_10755 [Acinetobacter qingfengensis]|uniref:DUF4142 domain-containing protein n=1 Tax=Acinetobacter qingfengensis TaxID=1262585 RepID=A0A1E7RCT0_9GAMM|nr:hypothetical protein [Acinetobacter qingfengensis]KAA8732094.1 hypothetical protein F4V57_10755 [Acinetobacter qingfengensis]OEY97174.1 hypothetical protein BJI46_01735 [Acinetobacter qingfengensis]